MKNFFKIKVFLKGAQLEGSEEFAKVLKFKDEFLPYFWRLFSSNPTCHACYPYSEYPEGNHLKLYIMTNKKKLIIKLIKNIKRMKDVEKIGREYGYYTEENEQLCIAESIFRRIEHLRDRPLDIINILQQDKDFLNLIPRCRASHFMANMLQPFITKEEIELYNFLESHSA